MITSANELRAEGYILGIIQKKYQFKKLYFNLFIVLTRATASPIFNYRICSK
jgi:hypothetical protein